MRTAYNLGAVVVFAAGNSSADVSDYSPVNMTDSKPVVVSAVTQRDTPAYFTNFGALVDVAAPGGGTTNPPPTYKPARNILSLRANNTDMGLPNLVVDGTYFRQAGTSMAAPHVAGLAALVLSHHPGFSNEEVRQVLRASADDVNSPGFDIYTGAGRINAAKALAVSSVLSAKITAPVNEAGYESGQTITVTGTASGTNFKQYELFYGLGGEPSSWISLGPPVQAPVQNATLGTLDTAALNGYFLLRLVVTSTSDVQFDDVVGIHINILQTPWRTGEHGTLYTNLSAGRHSTLSTAITSLLLWMGELLSSGGFQRSTEDHAFQSGDKKLLAEASVASSNDWSYASSHSQCC